MRIIHQNPAEIKEFENNSNIHTPFQIEKLKKSIAQFGFNVPVLVDKENVLIAGHARIQAAKEMGLEKIPTILLDHLSEAQKRAFIIADNRIAQDSGFDMDMLSEEYEFLLAEDEDLLDSVGFDNSDINKLEEMLSVGEPEEGSNKGDDNRGSQNENNSPSSNEEINLGEFENTCPKCGHEF